MSNGRFGNAPRTVWPGGQGTEVDGQCCVVPTAIGHLGGEQAKSPNDFLFTKWVCSHEACHDKIAAHLH